MDPIYGKEWKIWQNFLGMVFTIPKYKVHKKNIPWQMSRDVINLAD